ncbi:MAG TPA: translation initiation factor IF-2 [Planctomycetaceae bacterium]|nr:translation initiation factor IF-2 [Planctomycetaceae bacterium]
MKIRIFTLAKELDMDSKVLIGVCQKVGIHLKDSPLASISEEEKERVLAFIRQGASSTESADKAETTAPKREAVRPPVGKVPQIRTIPPRAPLSREVRRDEPEEVEAEGAEVVSAETAAPARPVVETPAKVAAEAPPLVGDKTPPAEADEEADDVSPPGGNAPVVPLRREDYLPASGTVRTMAPRGNMPQIAPPSARRPKARPAPQLPKLAEPPPSPKSPPGAPAISAEGPAQKPEMRLSRELLEGKPLHEHIRQHAEEKKKLKATGDEFVEDFTEEVKRPGVKPGVGGRGVAGMGLLSERKQRQAKRTRGPGMLSEDEELELQSSERLRQHRVRARRSGTIAPQKTSAEVMLPISVRGLSEAMGRRASELLSILARRGAMVTINSMLDEETALDLAMECGIDLQIARERDIEAELATAADAAAATGTRQPRPPIITILGHVDHGKTTLLDKIRSANVAAGEVGGITQHIAAYQVQHKGRKITFLDTPGHAAFGEMRARGANVTDVAVLVVAANDGVMPQTIEALNHARAAGVPIVVALNKVDLPDRNEQRVLQDLAGQNLLAAEWGGDTEVVRTSGTTGAGIEDLLETLLTVAELKELTADPTAPAHGVCLEAFRDEGRGAVAWLIVQDGTLRKGDVVLCGPAFGRIRSMYDDLDREIDEAGPSTPVKVAGLDVVPGAGDRFFVSPGLEEARQAATMRRERGREKQLAQRGKLRTLQEILSTAETGGVQDLPVIVKADTPGSLEALKSELLRFQHPEVRVAILHEGVGGVNESDVYLASASGAIIVAFHVVPEDRAEVLAEREGVEIRQYGIIYEVTDDIKLALEGLLRPEVVETDTGRAVVLQTFDISRFGRIAGCRVLKGVIERTHRIKLIRDQRILNNYSIASLKRNKDDAREVREGLECGIRLEGFDDIKEGDIFQAYKVEEIKRTL